MKKFILLFLMLFGLSCFSCPMEESEANDWIMVLVSINYTRQQAVTIINNVNNVRVAASNAGMNSTGLNTLTNSILNSSNPEAVSSNPALMNSVVTAQQNATNQGLGSLNVDYVSESGNNGLNISMSTQNGNTSSTTQINTSSSSPTYSTTGTYSVIPSRIATRLYTAQEENRPLATSTTTVDTSGYPVRIISSNRVDSNGEGGSVLASNDIREAGNSEDESSDISGKPRVITTNNLTVVKDDSTIATAKILNSKLLVVQTSTTTIMKQSGQTFNIKTIGNVVGDVTHSSIAQKRVVIGNEILQGSTIEISGSDVLVNGVIAKKENGVKYDSSEVSGSIYDVTVHAINRQPTTVLYDSTDSVGSSNIVTYWVNGVDTGVSANLKITRTLITPNDTRYGTSIVKKQLFNEASMPSTITFSTPSGYVNDGYLEEYIKTYSLKTSGENAGYYVSDDGNVRFSALIKTKNDLTRSSEFASSPEYATEFETKSGNTFRKRDDFIFFNSNSFMSIAYPSTKTSSNAEVRPTYSFGENMSVNNGEYYFIDDSFTGIVASNEDRIVDSYSQVDPAAKMNSVVSGSAEQTVTRNGSVILTTKSLGAKNINSITKNGKTITGEFTYGNVVFVTSGSTVKYGATVSLSDGYVYLDGINSEILESEATFETKTCYYVDGKPTDVERDENDNIVNTLYYTSNGELTDIQKLETDVIGVVQDSSNRSTSINDTTINVILSNGTSFKASNAEYVTTGHYINSTQHGTIYYDTKSTYNDRIIKKNGNNIGLYSDATFYTMKVSNSAITSIFAIQGTTPVQLVDSFSPSYYLPRLDGYYFVNNSRLYKYNTTVNSTLQPVSSETDFIKADGYFFVRQNMLFRGKMDTGSATVSTADNSKERSVSVTDAGLIKLFMTYAVLNNGHTRCVSCFNDESNDFISMAGWAGWGHVSIGVHKNGGLYIGTGHINKKISGTLDGLTFKKVVLLDDSAMAFLALASNGRLFKITVPSKKSCSSIEIVEFILDGGVSLTNIDSNRNGRAVAISNNAIYVINTDSSSMKKPVGFTPIDLVYGKSAVGIRTSSNELYTADIPTTALIPSIVFTKSSLTNVKEIGVINNTIICIGSKNPDEATTDVPMIRIGSNTYRLSDVVIENQSQLYKINGKKTMYKVAQTDTTGDVERIRFTTDSSTRDVVPSDISSFKRTTISRSATGELLAMTTATSGGNYYVNGNDTGIEADITDDIDIESKNTYYIGNVNTGIEPQTNNDNIQIKGDYWTINGHNTAVKYYGLGEMCVKISDVTPGEVDENDEVTASKVVVPLVVRAQIVRFDENKPITSIRFQYRKLTDENWTTLKELTNEKRKLETNSLQAIFGRYVNVPVSKSESFLVRVNISDGTTSTVTASSLQPETGNVFYYSFIRSTKDRLK